MGKKKPIKERDLLMFRVRPDVPSDQTLARQLRKASEITGVPVSQLLRDGGAYVVKEITKRHPEIAAA